MTPLGLNFKLLAAGPSLRDHHRVPASEPEEATTASVHPLSPIPPVTVLRAECPIHSESAFTRRDSMPQGARPALVFSACSSLFRAEFPGLLPDPMTPSLPSPAPPSPPVDVPAAERWCCKVAMRGHHEAPSNIEATRSEESY
eukprot:3637857-Rhodomonas_salina.1